MLIFLIDFYDRLNDTGVPFKDRFPLNYQLHFVKKEQQIRSVQVQEQKMLIYLSLQYEMKENILVPFLGPSDSESLLQLS